MKGFVALGATTSGDATSESESVYIYLRSRRNSLWAMANKSGRIGRAGTFRRVGVNPGLQLISTGSMLRPRHSLGANTSIAKSDFNKSITLGSAIRISSVTCESIKDK